MTPTQRKAMEQALEALEKARKHFSFERLGESRLEDSMRRGDMADATDALRAALADQPAEQVTNIGCLGMPVNTPVTAPQPAKRKPLTDEEIDAIWRTHLHRDSRVRAIERAHSITSEANGETK